jgi:hypothetical protein
LALNIKENSCYVASRITLRAVDEHKALTADPGHTAPETVRRWRLQARRSGRILERHFSLFAIRLESWATSGNRPDGNRPERGDSYRQPCRSLARGQPIISLSSPNICRLSHCSETRLWGVSDWRYFQLMRKLSGLFSSLEVLEFHVMRSNVA